MSVECASSTLQKFAPSRLLHPWRAPRITLQGSPLLPSDVSYAFYGVVRGSMLQVQCTLHNTACLLTLGFFSSLRRKFHFARASTRSSCCRSGCLPLPLPLPLANGSVQRQTQRQSLSKKPPLPVNHETAGACKNRSLLVLTPPSVLDGKSWPTWFD